MIRYEDVKPTPRERRTKVANSPVDEVANKVANKPTRDRREYQRELMRKRRSKTKHS